MAMTGMGGFSIIQFAFVSFYSVLMSNRLTEPTFTDLCRLSETMAYAEPEPDKKIIEEIKWLTDHTHEDIDVPLAQVEMMVFYQLHRGQTGLNKEMDIDGKPFKLIDLYGYLNSVNKRLTKIVVDIAKKYNLEIPMGMMSTSGKLQM